MLEISKRLLGQKSLKIYFKWIYYVELKVLEIKRHKKKYFYINQETRNR